MNVIFLDDDPNRQNRMKSVLPCIKQVWTADEAIEEISKHEHIDAVFLDHDLGGEVYVDSACYNTGMTVARWIAENRAGNSIDHIVIHTFNPVGARNMADSLHDKFRCKVSVCTFLSGWFNVIVNSLNDRPEATNENFDSL